MKKFWGILLSLAMMISILPSAYAQEEAYTVDKIYFTNLAGQVLENPTRACTVNIDVTKNADRLGKDVAVIASYSTDGAMIGFTTVAGTMDKGETDTFSTLVMSPNDKDIGVVKAYIWNNISEMRALSAVKQIVVNQMDEGVELPSVEDKPIAEKYIPDVITCTGTITATSRTNAGLDNDEYYLGYVRLLEDYSDCGTSDEYTALKNRNLSIIDEYNLAANAYISNMRVTSELDLNDYLFCNVEAEITKNVKGNYVVVGVQQISGNNDILKLDAADYVETADADGNSLETNGKIKFGSKAYTMAYAVDLYVNGALYATVNKHVSANDYYVGTTWGASDAMLDKFLGGAQGTISLVKGENDEGYSKILLTYYDVAEVTSVISRNGKTTIQFNNANNAVTSLRKIIINDDTVEDGDCKVNVMMNGKKIGIDEVKKGDIIAFATDMYGYGTSRETEDPEFLTVLVSRDTVCGMCTKRDEDNYTYTVGGKVYKMAQYWNSGYLYIGSTYTLNLDPFGRIFTAEEEVGSVNYAIVEKYTSDDKVRLVLADGTIADYDTTLSGTQVKEIYFDSSTNSVRPVTDRVVEYTCRKSTNEITALKVVVTGIAFNSEYKAKTSKLGGARIGDFTKVIDASEYEGRVSEYNVFDVSSFKNGTEYSGAYFKPSGAANAGFVILTYIGDENDTGSGSGGSIGTETTEITSKSRFAVVRKAADPEIIDGDDCYTMNVLADGMEKTLVFDTSVDTDQYAVSTWYDLNAYIAQGDAFYYTLNSEGRVDGVYKVLDFTKYNKTTHVWDNSFNASALSTVINRADWNFNYYDNGSYIQLVYGIVTDAANDYITFAQINNGKIDTNCDITSSGDTVGTATFDISSDAVFYEYDQFATGKESNKINVTQSVLESNIDMFETAQNSYIYDNATVSSENINDYLTYALAMVVDGEIVEIYSFINY